ncbi:hypothetical protein [Methylibium petroleiphilum]|uniref:hypothetical protein n=1 Tax=Methylibium petroleiphilum TaxID=105560 RepID=UPI001AD50BAC|nr:hypothetical protein [Methylibium petroleiphilum]MBN9203848.1 hypothetical protein [Methylibium petroleiphilum]
MGIYDRDWYRATLRKRQGLPPEDGRSKYSPRPVRSPSSDLPQLGFTYWWTAFGWWCTGWLMHKHWPAIKAFFATLK